MYKLEIGKYKDFNRDFDYINSDYIPRQGELIKKYKVITEDDDENEVSYYYWTLEVQKVSYELFEDKSSMPVVYANVIKEEVISNG